MIRSSAPTARSPAARAEVAPGWPPRPSATASPATCTTLLGHSLTTITVKAGLARRLARGRLAAGAVPEIAEVEGLCRQSWPRCGRGLRLPGDGRWPASWPAAELLRSPASSPTSPRRTDVVGPAHQELFGWAVREGLTNVVRHARARALRGAATGRSVEILDDGVGPSAAVPRRRVARAASERVEAAGGAVDAGPVRPCGWRLWVSLDAAAVPPVFPNAPASLGVPGLRCAAGPLGVARVRRALRVFRVRGSPGAPDPGGLLRSGRGLRRRP